MIIIYIAFILLFISFCAKWIMDTLQFHYDKSFFKNLDNQDFWNPILSWDNKYLKYLKRSKIIKWLIENPLCFLTDGWHLFQFIELNSFIIGFSLLVSTNIDLQIILTLSITPFIGQQYIIVILSYLIGRLLYSISNILFYKN